MLLILYMMPSNTNKRLFNFIISLLFCLFYCNLNRINCIFYIFNYSSFNTYGLCLAHSNDFYLIRTIFLFPYLFSNKYSNLGSSNVNTNYYLSFFHLLYFFFCFFHIFIIFYFISKSFFLYKLFDFYI